jgi:nitrogenase molybdenum-iron protein alpha chain
MPPTIKFKKVPEADQSVAKPPKPSKLGPIAIAPLGPESAPSTVQPGNWKTMGSRAGLLVTGGCGFNGASIGLWGPLGDIAAISHGPVGCGHYALAARKAAAGRINGIDGFSEIHFTTDFQERDVVFGGDIKLEQCIDELNMLFPLAQGFSVLSECPVGLIGDDIEAVARKKRVETGKLVAPVRCEGFRGCDLILSDTKAILRAEGHRSERIETTPYDVAIICFDTGYGHAKITKELMESIGLRVVAQWPGNSTSRDIGQLSQAKLIVVPNIGKVKNVYGETIEKEFGVPLLDVVIHSPDTIDAALRAVAANFDAHIQEQAEKVIAANRPKVDAALAEYLPRLKNKLYLALGFLAFHVPEPFHALGMRVGTTFQGWPDQDGTWHSLPEPYLYRTLTDEEVSTALAQAKPDLISGMAEYQDDRFFLKWGYQPFNWYLTPTDESYWGYDGFIRLAKELDRAINSPWRQLLAPPWKQASCPA